jgi:uncharacterized protein YprB with RNaseH-like and TPR domain
LGGSLGKAVKRRHDEYAVSLKSKLGRLGGRPPGSPKVEQATLFGPVEVSKDASFVAPNADTRQPPNADTLQPPNADTRQPPNADTRQPPNADTRQPPNDKGESVKDGTSSADVGRERHETLQELRAKMDELLSHSPKPSPKRVNVSDTKLPFEPIDVDGLLLHRRQLRLSPSKAIGRIPVDAARSANQELLTLLALDPRLHDCDPSKALYLDTETTGLGGGTGTLAFLIGLAWFDEKGAVLEQLLLMSPAEEPALLRYLDRCLARSSMLVTFNGKSFDWPLLQSRYVMNRRSAPDGLPHLDLLSVARRLHRKRLGSVSLKRLESEVLGLNRGPDIDGSEIAPRYYHFLRTADASVLEVVIEHNVIDVLSMMALVGLYGEPLELLAPLDLVALGHNFIRAKAHDRASAVAELARTRGAGPEAIRLSARVAKARGDKQKALLDFEELASEISDDTVRLELAKLYEHVVRDPKRALACVEQGTGERMEALAKRKARLIRKLEKRNKV